MTVAYCLYTDVWSVHLCYTGIMQNGLAWEPKWKNTADMKLALVSFSPAQRLLHVTINRLALKEVQKSYFSVLI